MTTGTFDVVVSSQPRPIAQERNVLVRALVVGDRCIVLAVCLPKQNPDR
jgi:hypothetical protein